MHALRYCVVCAYKRRITVLNLAESFISKAR
jgi:hypothetical protein